MMYLLVTVLAAVQEDLTDVDGLQSADIRFRERAERRLADHGPEWLPLLRRRSAMEGDPEVKARLEAAADVILMRQANRLLREGDVEAALRALSADEADVEGFLDQNKQAVEREIRGWYPQSEETSDCTIDNATVADRIQERFGPWGIAVLLEILGHEEKAVPAPGILVEMGDDVVPCLARALGGGSSVFRRGALTVLYVRVCVNSRPLEEWPGFSEALRSVEEDVRSDSDTRFHARSLLDFIAAIADGD